MKEFKVGDFITIQDEVGNFPGVYLIDEKVSADSEEQQFYRIVDTESIVNYVVPGYFITLSASIFSEEQ